MKTITFDSEHVSRRKISHSLNIKHVVQRLSYWNFWKFAICLIFEVITSNFQPEILVYRKFLLYLNVLNGSVLTLLLLLLIKFCKCFSTTYCAATIQNWLLVSLPSCMNKWSLALMIYFVIVNKVAENCRFVHIYYRNP